MIWRSSINPLTPQNKTDNPQIIIQATHNRNILILIKLDLESNMNSVDLPLPDLCPDTAVVPPSLDLSHYFRL